MMIEIRLLRPDDDRSSFSSGAPDLDRFFRKYAGQNQFRLHIGTTYIASHGKDIVGFITISATSITIENLPRTMRKGFPRYPLPALRVARLAVSQDAQGRGIGKRLLRAAFSIAQEMSDQTGCIGVVVDAKENAVAFYKQYGFQPLKVIAGRLHDRPSPLPMFLPLGSIQRSTERGNEDKPGVPR
ncbi:MAG: GNAT family N-acetyltransferase [Deltaproteobacteria bacterium]|nr:GNAT family N-acetyltransferase [Deltaproteobacteria bacterium]MBW1796337.1 GNAT family N-acetyltransferase [Deltaproteobacteria bacterium]MBW1908668.1 GNAT family N-acetyltransferase [Deltaproteobacteria bacterium]MBW2032465.1 GNAT family N-acetyltransferase [Deltaproteobacteria bacterium]MBW2113328.1 GNAT family N-acetyltransferase [Deltaproteobacteria bacterium]